MKFRKSSVILLLLVLAFTFCACGGGTITTGEANEYLDEEGTETTGAASGEVTIMVECKTILDNMEKLDASKQPLVPADGILIAETTVTFEEGESVLDVLKRVTKDNKMQMEFEETPAYDGGYVNSINNLYEFDCGAASGWEYFVND